MPRGRPKGSGKGKQVKAVPVQFDPAEEVEDVAKELIPKHHTSLINSEIAYLFKNKEMSRKGKMVLATAEKCSKKVTAISGKDFVIVVSYPGWTDLTPKQKYALVDHELTHCLVDDDDEGNEVTKTIPHDFEEFYSIIERHNLWTSDLIALGRVVKKAVENESELDVIDDEGDEDDD